MKKIEFTKMVGSGNDFVVIDLSHQITKSPSYHELAKKICDRKFGVGADGLLVLEKSKRADVKMRIFNADGSEAEMCGNGARCVALFQSTKHKSQSTRKIKIETKAGIIDSEIKGANVKVKLTNPKDLKLDIPMKIGSRVVRINFINTGVPHVVIFTEGLEKIDILYLARFIRYHKIFSPKGTNVNFVEAAGKDYIKVRTYERGVEDETLACGTGSVASALIFALKSHGPEKIKVQTKSAEILIVYFKKEKNRFFEVWLEGKVRVIFKGEYFQ